MRTWAAASVVLFGALWAPPVWAQVNTEKLRHDLRDRHALIKLDADFVGRLGNVEGLSLGLGLFSGVRQGPHLLFLRTTVDYARFNDTTTMARAFAHARYNLHLTGPWSGELFAQVQQDRFQRLAFRSLLGAGPRLALLDTTARSAFAGVAYMIEREAIAVAPGAADRALRVSHRLSSYLSANANLAADTSTSSVIYLQPLISRPSDFRVLFEASLTQRLSKAVATRILVLVRHDSLPPTSVRRTDAEVRNVLEVVAF